MSYMDERAVEAFPFWSGTCLFNGAPQNLAV